MQEVLYCWQTVLLFVELPLQIVSFCELVFHVVFHWRDFLLCWFQLVYYTLFQRLNLVEVGLYLLFLYAETSCCCFRVFKLSLLEFQIVFHFLDHLLGWQLILTSHCFLHVLMKGCNVELVITDFVLKLFLLNFEFFCKFVDLFFFLV